MFCIQACCQLTPKSSKKYIWHHWNLFQLVLYTPTNHHTMYVACWMSHYVRAICSYTGLLLSHHWDKNVECLPHLCKYSMLLNWSILPYSTKYSIIYNVIFAGILHYCSILSYSPVITMLNLVICCTHWTLGVLLHSGKCGTAVTSINGSFFVIVASDPKRPVWPPGFLAASILKAGASGVQARPDTRLKAVAKAAQEHCT